LWGSVVQLTLGSVTRTGGEKKKNAKNYGKSFPIQKGKRDPAW